MAIVYRLENYDMYVLEDKKKYKVHKGIRIQLDSIMKRLFNLKNKIPIIDFLNAAYGDNISYDADITYGDKEFSNIERTKKFIKYVNFFADMYIQVEDGNNRYEYEIEFQTKYEKGLIIRLFRYSFERAVKLLDYRKLKDNFIEINYPEPYIIVVEEEEEVPDVLALKFNFPKQESFIYECKILKYYEKDIGTLEENNMYLLLPLSIVKLRRELEKLSTHKEISDKERNRVILELKEIIESTLKSLDILYNKSKITLEDYDGMVTVMENIGSYLESNYGKIIGIEEEISTMVKSFYDPKIEEKGIQKGIQKGIEEGMEKGIEKGKEAERKELVLKQYKKGLSIDEIADLNDLDREYVKGIVSGRNK